MNVLSLFDGISCGCIALERCGIKVDNYFASEIDKHAIKISKANWPDIKHIGDVRSVSAANLPKIDLILAGSPCQGFSFAGDQLAFDDPRSALFFEFIRILNECRENNPDVLFLLENVNMAKKHQVAITHYCGLWPVRINSNLVSAQNRDRLYWTNIRTAQLGFFDIVSDIPQPKDKGIFLKDILQGEVDKKYFLSAAAIARIAAKKDKGWSFAKINPEKTGTLVARSNSGQFSASGGDTVIYQKARGFNNGGEFSDKSPTLTSNSWEWNNLLGNSRRLTPVECERLQTVPHNYTGHVSDTQRYRALGNSWTVDVIAHILSYIQK